MTDVKVAVDAFLSLGWIVIPKMAGNFCVSPDQGDFKRVFMSDVKRKGGYLRLLGGIGLCNSKSIKCRMPILAAYITNFDELSCHMEVHGERDAQKWARYISQFVMALPSDEIALLKDIADNKIGPFRASPFLVSSIGWEKFLSGNQLKNSVQETDNTQGSTNGKSSGSADSAG